MGNKGLIVGILFLLLMIVQIAIVYVLVPFVLVKVLAFFGVKLSFWIAVGIVFLINFTISKVKVSVK